MPGQSNQLGARWEGERTHTCTRLHSRIEYRVISNNIGYAPLLLYLFRRRRRAQTEDMVAVERPYTLSTILSSSPDSFIRTPRAQTPHYYNRQSFLSRPHRGIYCMKVLDVSPVCVSQVHKSSKELDVIKTGFFKYYDFGALGVKLANPCWQTLYMRNI